MRSTRRPWLFVITLAVILIAGVIIATNVHHHSPTTASAPATSAPPPTSGPTTASSTDPFAGITPMDAAGVAGFPLTHMSITQDGVNLHVTVDDGAAITKLAIQATVPLNGTPVTPHGNCVTIPGQIPACVVRWQAHQDQVSAWIQAQSGQCELTGHTTPGVRTQITCATTHQ